MAFYTGGPYPAAYDNAMFFADYSRDCIWAMFPGSNGLPNPANVVTLAAGAANPVGLTIGPNGDLFYPDFDGGTVRRITLPVRRQPAAERRREREPDDRRRPALGAVQRGGLDRPERGRTP